MKSIYSLLATASFIIRFAGAPAPLILGALSASPAAAFGSVFPKKIFQLPPVAQEISGAALTHEGRYLWSIGDSGVAPVLFRTDLSSRELKTIEVPVVGAKNEDWEAIVVDPSNPRALWILDVGDNDARRSSVSIYHAELGDALTEARVTRRIDVMYLDGPRDVEAGVIVGEKLYLFEKSYTGPARVVWLDVSSDAPHFQFAANSPTLPAMGPITDAALGPKGEIYLLTYVDVVRCVSCFRFPLPTPIRLGFLGQAETLVVRPQEFWVGTESGRFFRW